MPTSTELRKLNNYPEFKTKEGINGVINYIVSKVKLSFQPQLKQRNKSPDLKRNLTKTLG